MVKYQKSVYFFFFILTYYSMSYHLHAVIIKKPVKLIKAKQEASEIINNDNRKFYRETNESYRFRNIPKTKFIKSTFRSKPINKNITLVYGKMKNK